MEEILASIRRIIADDRILPLSPRPPKGLAAGESAPAVPVPEADPEPDAAASLMPLADRSNAPRLGGQRRGDPLVGPPPRETGPDMRSLRILSGPSDQLEAADAPALEGDDFLGGLSGKPDFNPPESAAPSQPEPPPLRAAERRDQAPMPETDPILSAAADASVASSFQSLATTVFLQNGGLVEQSVRDMLRPMLKQWLDEHLPTIVERLVRAEIERVARGGRA